MNLQTSKIQVTSDNRNKARVRLDRGLEKLVEFESDVSRVSQALVKLSDNAGESAARAIERHIRNIDAFEPTITVLGQVKAGKTALVNAMVGWDDLLPSDVNPWTSVVTSLHLNPNMSETETAARFRFLSDKEWDRLLSKGGRIGELSERAGAESELKKISEQIAMMRERARQRLGDKFEMLIGQEHEYGYFDKNLLEKYICVGDDFLDNDDIPEATDQGQFAEILRSADLFLSKGHFPCGLCLRDTPGVNDTFMMREQITVQAIRESRLCIVVLSANQALTSVDMGLIRLISTLKSRDIVIFVNRIDELENPSEQVPEIEQSIRATLAAKRGPDDVRIIFGSAFWASSVLSDDIENIPYSSAQSLLNWTEASLDSETGPLEPQDIVWEMSGLPDLFRALSDRIVDGIGASFLQKITASATTVATGFQAAGRVRLTGGHDIEVSHEHAVELLDRLSRTRLAAFDQDVDRAISEYFDRTDRAHAQFIERATQSLISHLERYGPIAGWKYDPTGLRLLIRSGYSVFSRRIQTLVSEHSNEALVDVAHLYTRAFGEAVEGIQLAMPEPPPAPPPVSLGQTIALDFNDGWWMSWWKRMRGYDAFARQFRALIAAETEDFIDQLKTIQTQEMRTLARSVLGEFFTDQRNILSEMSATVLDGGDVHTLPQIRNQHSQLDNLEEVLEVLRSHADRRRNA
ncbi:MAG: dynamin family protein [Pseudomonadota bacterium]